MAEQESTGPAHGFPLKDRWTTDEALSLIEVNEGIECVRGVPFPQYVQTQPDRVRWINSLRVAAMVFDEPPSSVLVMQAARTFFNDRETFTD